MLPAGSRTTSIWGSIHQRVQDLANHLNQDSSLFLFGLLLGTIHLISQPYYFGVENHAIQIPILKKYFHPNLYPNDIMVETYRYFPTLYYLLLGGLNEIFGNLQLIFFIAQILTKTLFFIAIYQFALTLFQDHRCAVVATFLMFFDGPMLASEILQWTYHTHTYAALPLLLWSFTLFLKGQTRKAYAIAGVAANIHLQSAIFVYLMFAVASLIRFRRDNAQKQKTTRSLVGDLVVFLCFGSPCIVWALASSNVQLTQAWLEQLQIRSLHHSFPLSWSPEVYSKYAVFLATGVVMASLALKNGPQRDRDLTMASFAATILWLCLIGLVFSEWIPVKFVLTVQFFRSTKFLTIFIILYASRTIIHYWEGSFAYKLLAIVLFLMFFLPFYSSVLPLLLILLLVIEWKKVPWWSMAVAAAALVIVIYENHIFVPAIIQSDPFTRISKIFFANKMKAALSAGLVSWYFFNKIRIVRHVAFFLIAATIIFSILPRVYRKHELKSRNSWQSLQLWAKDNTQTEARFLTPPGTLGFRIFSERSTVVEWKDGTQQYFSGDFSSEWMKRMKDLGGKEESDYRRLSANELLKLSQKYGAEYIVAYKGTTLPFKKMYENADWVIYQLN